MIKNEILDEILQRWCYGNEEYIKPAYEELCKTDVDWTTTNEKFCISRRSNRIEVMPCECVYHVLAFNTRSEAERFLKHNEQLVKDFYML